MRRLSPPPPDQPPIKLPYADPPGTSPPMPAASLPPNHAHAAWRAKPRIRLRNGADTSALRRRRFAATRGGCCQRLEAKHSMARRAASDQLERPRLHDHGALCRIERLRAAAGVTAFMPARGARARVCARVRRGVAWNLAGNASVSEGATATASVRATTHGHASSHARAHASARHLHGSLILTWLAATSGLLCFSS